jgi:RNA 2',3'-cyclic 3'-phosphodiesterase
MGSGQLGQETRGAGAPLKVRAFFGLPLPEGHRRALDPYLVDCASRAPGFRWTPAANLHLTVRFLGHVAEEVAATIARRIVEAAPAGFELRLGGPGTFRRGRLARVAWIGLDQGESEASALAALVEVECVGAGLAPETRRFRGHLTLARSRLREGAPLPEMPPPPALPAWRAAELVLYRSRLGRQGSVYEPMRLITLR